MHLPFHFDLDIRLLVEIIMSFKFYLITFEHCFRRGCLRRIFRYFSYINMKVYEGARKSVNNRYKSMSVERVFSIFFVQGEVEFVTLGANFDYLY